MESLLTEDNFKYLKDKKAEKARKKAIKKAAKKRAKELKKRQSKVIQFEKNIYKFIKNNNYIKKMLTFALNYY